MAKREKFRKKSYSLPEFLRDLFGVAMESPALASSVIGPRPMDPLFREEIFSAVARANECRYCTYIHEGFAGFAGASDKELAELAHFTDDVPRGAFDRKRWVALCYARAFVTDTLSEELCKEAATHYAKEELAQIRATAAVMGLTSQSGNTVDSLLARLRGDGGVRDDVSILEEAIITLLAAPVGGPAVAGSFVARRVRQLRRLAPRLLLGRGRREPAGGPL